jgi:hypothetical protein
MTDWEIIEEYRKLKKASLPVPEKVYPPMKVEVKKDSLGREVYRKWYCGESHISYDPDGTSRKHTRFVSGLEEDIVAKGINPIVITNSQGYKESWTYWDKDCHDVKEIVVNTVYGDVISKYNEKGKLIDYQH